MNVDMSSYVLAYARHRMVVIESLAQVGCLADVDGDPPVGNGLVGEDVVASCLLKVGANGVNLVAIFLT